MPEIKERLQKAGINIIMSYIEKDPEKNLEKLLDGFDLFSNGSFAVQRKYFRKFLIDNPDSNWRKLAMRVLKEMHPRVLNKLVANFFLNANMIGWKKQEELRNKYNCNIPWAILLDPTSACNLHCTGCWAAEYGNRLNLSYEDIDSIIRQGKELGVYFYIYTGGEPLVRKKDIIRLCEEHDDCIFLSFTNGTLIDEAFANAMLRVGKFIPAISVEGFEEATDGRRGAGHREHLKKRQGRWRFFVQSACLSEFPHVTPARILKVLPAKLSTTRQWPGALTLSGISTICLSERMRCRN